MEHNFIENQLVILTKQTLDIFLREENPADLISLYTFYYYTAKWQGTNQPKCTTDYVANGLHWSKAKVVKVKKQLLEYGLIEDVRLVDEETKRVKGYYIKMNYIFKNETQVQCIQKPPTGNRNGKKKRASVSNFEGVEFEHTNALSANNSNALSANNFNIYGENQKTVSKETLINDNFEKLWNMLKSTQYDRKSKVTKKRKQELFKMGFERTSRAIEVYLRVQDPNYYHKRDNFLNEIIDNYLDKTENDFNNKPTAAKPNTKNPNYGCYKRADESDIDALERQIMYGGL